MAKQQTPYRMTALADIKPYDRNPRIIPQAAVDAVALDIAPTCTASWKSAAATAMASQNGHTHMTTRMVRQ